MAVTNPKPNTVIRHSDVQGANCGAAGAWGGRSQKEENQRSHLASRRGGAIKKTQGKKYPRMPFVSNHKTSGPLKCWRRKKHPGVTRRFLDALKEGRDACVCLRPEHNKMGKQNISSLGRLMDVSVDV